MDFIVNEALKVLPEKSRYHRCIADVIKWHKENPTDWKYAWQKAQDNYTDETDCPSEPGGTFRIDAVINGAYIVIGLLYGEGDFERTIDISTRCGQDSDCNPASAAGVLGTMLGYSNIPEKWMPNVREVEDLPFAYTDISLNKASELSFKQALQVIEKNGGKVGKKYVKIKVQEPQAVRYEQSFEGVSLKEIVNVDKHAVNNDVEFTFNGSGIVLSGRLRNRQDGDYKAITDITLDGKPFATVEVGENAYTSQDHIFHAYDLEDGEHSVKIHVRNPRKDKQLWVGRALVYTK